MKIRRYLCVVVLVLASQLAGGESSWSVDVGPINVNIINSK